MWGADQRIVAAGVPLRVIRAGDGPPLVLLNGIGAPAEMWGPLVARLDGRAVVACDLPGTGSSPSTPWPLRIRALAGLVADVLDVLGLERADVLGYSFGGIVAQELAYRSPERVDRLVLAATAPGLGSFPPNPLAAFMMLSPVRYSLSSVAYQMVPMIAGGRTSRDPDALDHDIRARLANPSSTWGYLSQLYAVSGWTSLPWLGQIAQPTLILHGDDDPLVPLANARTFERRIPDARLVVVPDAGHLFLFDEPDSVAGELAGFLGAQRV